MAEHIQIPTCTAQLPDGAFCDLPSAEDMPFPICGRHAHEVWARITTILEAGQVAQRFEAQAAAREASLAQHREERRAAEAERQRIYAAQSVVYYARMGNGLIKIGYTKNLRLRCTDLRISTNAILATEPGAEDVERMRHRQFAAFRHGRTEEFDPSDELLGHMERIRRQHGAPKITRYVRAG